MFSSWFCLDFFAVSQVPWGYHPRLQWCALLLWAALASLLPVRDGRDSAGFAFGSGWSWCLLEETSVVQAEE